MATTGVAPGTAAPVAERLNDSGITASIQSKYFLDSNIKGRRIDVDTHQGVVTLRGEVANGRKLQSRSSSGSPRMNLECT